MANAKTLMNVPSLQTCAKHKLVLMKPAVFVVLMIPTPPTVTRVMLVHLTLVASATSVYAKLALRVMDANVNPI